MLEAASRGVSSSGHRAFRAASLAAALLIFGCLVARFWCAIDDAYITFRYSRNLAAGLGVRYNPTENPPVEGYSNFLWMLLCAAFETLKLNTAACASIVSAASGAALILLVHRRLVKLDLPLPAIVVATLALAAFPPLALWSTTGMETAAFALAIYATTDALILRDEKPRILTAIVAGIVLCLVRVEGPAWALSILLLACAARILDGEWKPSRRGIAASAAGILAAFLAYFAWRYAYFGGAIANTAHAKSGVLSIRFERGLRYVASHFVTFVSPAIVLAGGTLAALFGARRGKWLAIAAMGFAFPAYAVLVTGDFMPMGRFLLPAAPFWTLLMARLLASIPTRTAAINWTATTVAGVLLIAIQTAPAWNMHLAPREWLERLRFRYNTPVFMTEYEAWRNQMENVAEWKELGRGLRDYCRQLVPPPATPSVVLGAIGAAGYESDLYVYDRHGLVTPEVARRPLGPDEPLLSPGHDRRVPPEFFLKDKPTILRYRQLMRVSRAEVAAAARQMAAELRAAAAKTPELLDYAPDIWQIIGPDKEGKADYLVMWVCVGGERATAAWEAFDAKVRDLAGGSDQGAGGDAFDLDSGA
ncbi:MAG: hypothetical protein HZB38_07720 [Planctomycetes bacterium]|nr:hypothetical protein [Planctomycetota bacterium]